MIPPTSLVVGLLVGYIGVYFFTARRTSSLRDRSRTVTATFVILDDIVETHGAAATLSKVTDTFAELDASLRSGELTPAHYELAWASVIAGLPETPPAYSWARRTRSMATFALELLR